MKTTIRKEDALKFLRRALEAPPKSKARQTRLEHALFAYYCGTINEHQFGKRGDRRRGHARHNDREAVALMQGIAGATGEGRPYKLARLAIESGQIDLANADPASVAKRLVIAYRQIK